MWKWTAALLAALLMFTDLIVNIVSVRYLGLDLVGLALLNSLWTIVFIPVARISSNLADRGVARRQAALGAALLVASQLLLYLSLALSSVPVLFLAYAVEAVSFPFVRLGIQAGLLESVPSERWGVENRYMLARQLLFESLVLLSVSRIGLRAFSFTYLPGATAATALVGALAALTLPEPSVRIERTLSRFQSLMNRALVTARGVLEITSLDFSGLSSANLVLAPVPGPRIGLPLIFLGLAGFRISNEYLFTPLPYFLVVTRGLPSDVVLAVYGVSKLISIAPLLLTPSNSTSPGFLALALALRLASVFAIVALAPGPIAMAVILSLVYYSNAVIDSSLYALFVEAMSGYGVGLYSIAGKVSSLVGTLTSGYVMVAFGPWAVVAAAAAASLLGAPLVTRPRG
ncbi:MAG: hypothetical protein ABWK00_03925 [Desulfurococcaceae archaeon]